jgi:hypothetical protein
MKIYVLVDKKTGLYRRYTWPGPAELTGRLDRASLYRSKTSARLSANHGFKLSEDNGQFQYRVLEIDVN